MRDRSHVHPLLILLTGDTLARYVRFLNADALPLDLTAPRIVVEWKLAAAKGTPIITKVSGDNGVDIVDPTHGLVRVLLAPAETAALAPGRYRDEVRVRFPGGVFSKSSGNIEIIAAPA